MIKLTQVDVDVDLVSEATVGLIKKAFTEEAKKKRAANDTGDV